MNKKLKQGQALQASGKFKEAGQLFEEILQADPYCVEALSGLCTCYEHIVSAGHASVPLRLALAKLYLLQSKMNEALLQYDAALKQDPASIPAHYQLGLYFLKTQAYAWGATQFKNVLALDEHHLDAAFHLGVCQVRLNALEEAKQAFESVLQLEPAYLEAWVNLGAIALKQNEGQQAIGHFTQALVLEPNHEVARSNLAATFMHYGRHENALTHYLILLETAPHNAEYLYNAAVAEMTLGQLDQAQARFTFLLTHQPAHFETLYNLAVIQLRRGQKTKAKTYLNQALRLRPDDASCLHLLGALSGTSSSTEVAAQYAKRLFDHYAAYYDQHLLSALHYRLPVTIVTILQTHGLTQQICTLDLGCGTGLCGEMLRPFTQQLVGVDLSEKMIERAQTKGCYDVCVVQDAVKYLEETDLTFDLIVAADLFPYLGELKPCFEGVRRCLRPGGSFVFSVEIAKHKPWELQRTARHAHHPDYIRALCAEMGLEIYVDEVKVAREQAGESVAVRVYWVK